VVDALADPEVRQRLADLGQVIFPREQQTPEALGAFHKANAVFGRNGIYFDCARAHLLNRLGHLDNFQVDLPGHQVLHGRTAATIRHELKPGACGVLEQNAANMLDTAEAEIDKWWPIIKAANIRIE
jgi:hypothetical protein